MIQLTITQLRILTNDQFMEVDNGCNDIIELQKEVEELRVQLTIAEASLRKSLFRLENIRYDNDSIQVVYRIF